MVFASLIWSASEINQSVFQGRTAMSLRLSLWGWVQAGEGWHQMLSPMWKEIYGSVRGGEFHPFDSWQSDRSPLSHAPLGQRKERIKWKTSLFIGKLSFNIWEGTRSSPSSGAPPRHALKKVGVKLWTTLPSQTCENHRKISSFWSQWGEERWKTGTDVKLSTKKICFTLFLYWEVSQKQSGSKNCHFQVSFKNTCVHFLLRLNLTPIEIIEKKKQKHF